MWTNAFWTCYSLAITRETLTWTNSRQYQRACIQMRATSPRQLRGLSNTVAHPKQGQRSWDSLSQNLYVACRPACSECTFFSNHENEISIGMHRKLVRVHFHPLNPSLSTCNGTTQRVAFRLFVCFSWSDSSTGTNSAQLIKTKKAPPPPPPLPPTPHEYASERLCWSPDGEKKECWYESEWVREK